MEEKIIKEVEELDCNNLLGSSTHILCQDVLKYLSIKNLELFNIKNIDDRTACYTDLILFLATLKWKLTEKNNQYKVSLTSLYEKNLFPILEKASCPLILPDKVLSDIDNHFLFTQISLIGFIEYQEQFVLSWSGQNEKDLQKFGVELDREATKVRLKIQQYERNLYTKQKASDKVTLHLNSLHRAIKDRKSIGLDTNELDDSIEHYKLLIEEIDLQERLTFSPSEEMYTIDVESLKEYFTPQFKGMGNGNIDYFSSMIEDLKKKRTAKEFAQIALIIYNSKQLNARRPSTFAKWYKVFCKCVGCKYSEGYKPSNLKDIPTNLLSLFSYL